jgi:hypothetical protein
VVLKHSGRYDFGTTLVETVIAFFIIVGGFGVVTGLYASTFQTQANDVEVSVLVNLAESRMGELRAAASDITAFGNLSSQSGTVNPAAHPAFQVETAVDTAVIGYPCTGLQTLPYNDSYRRAVVRVTAPSGRQLELTSLIGCPVTSVDRLEVTRTTGTDPLARDAQADFVADLIDSTGSPIPDVQFRFYVAFGTGNGRLVELPDGRTVQFFNHIVNPFGTNLYTGGSAGIIGRSFYGGREYRGVSSLLNLAP